MTAGRTNPSPPIDGTQRAADPVGAEDRELRRGGAGQQAARRVRVLELARVHPAPAVDHQPAQQRDVRGRPAEPGDADARPLARDRRERRGGRIRSVVRGVRHGPSSTCGEVAAHASERARPGGEEAGNATPRRTRARARCAAAGTPPRAASTPSSESIQAGHASPSEGSASPIATSPSGVGSGPTGATGSGGGETTAVADRGWCRPPPTAAREHARGPLRPGGRRGRADGAARARRAGRARAATRFARRPASARTRAPVRDRLQRSRRTGCGRASRHLPGRGIGLIFACATLVANTAGSTRKRAKRQESARIRRNHESFGQRRVREPPAGPRLGGLDLGAGSIRIRPPTGR